MNVWVVRNSLCGNGNDYSGEVLAVFSSQKAAHFDCQQRIAQQRLDSELMDIYVEGPFILQTEQEKQ